MLGWNCYKINRTLIVGTPFIDALYLNTAGTGLSAVTSYGQAMAGLTAATMVVDPYNVTPANYVRPIFFCGQDASYTGNDWNLKFVEDKSVANPDRTGNNYFLDIDTGFVRAEFARPFPNVVNADNSTAPIDYGHSIRNYGSITGVVNIGG